MNLWALAEKQIAILKSFCPSIAEHHRQRFAELGFREGEPVKCIQRTPLGAPRIFEVGSTVYSLSKEDAIRIFLLPQT